MVWYCVVWYDVVWCDVVWCGTAWYCEVWWCWEEIVQCGDDASSADLDLHPYSIVPHSTIYIKKFQSSPVPCFHVSNTDQDYIHTQSNSTASTLVVTSQTASVLYFVTLVTAQPAEPILGAGFKTGASRADKWRRLSQNQFCCDFCCTFVWKK